MPATTIAIVAAGAMGSGVARRLVENGARVLTLLEGRSAASKARAEAAGMEGTDLPGLAAAETLLSILPPGEAMAFARRAAGSWAGNRRPVFVDCNAIDVATAKAVGAVVSDAGAAFVDGGIIGTPPVPGQAGPILYLAGERAGAVASLLGGLGLRTAAMDGPPGAASALKMSYAGITKGLTAVATMMILGAERAGAGEALRAELASSQKELLARFGRGLPDMVPKAYRWVAEMREIAQFLEPDAAGAAAFRAIAELYDRVARDAEGEGREVAVIEAFAAGR